MNHLKHSDTLVDERLCQDGHLFTRPRVKVGRHLVKHEVARTHRDDARDGDELLLTARKLCRALVRQVFCVASRQRLVRPRNDLTPLQPEIRRTKAHLVKHTCAHELAGGILTHVSHRTHEVDASLAIRPYLARDGLRGAVCDTRKSGFAASVDAENRNPLAWPDDNRHVIKSKPIGGRIREAHVLDFEHGPPPIAYSKERGPQHVPGPPSGSSVPENAYSAESSLAVSSAFFAFLVTGSTLVTAGLSAVFT